MDLRPHTPILVLVIVVGFACDTTAQTLASRVEAIDSNAPIARVDTDEYPFADAHQTVTTLDSAFRTPEGYQRIGLSSDSFGAWLRRLPLRLDRQHVESHKGQRLASPSAAIVAIDVGERNLQQCADSAIRLHAEYLWARGRSAELAYHFTSGDEVVFSDWVGGERISVDGAKVKRRRGAPRPSDHASMRRWLDLVFMYAGTQSLHRDSKAVHPKDAQPGDFFVAPGGPGHAVVILDIAVRKRDGRRVALIGQGFMPAQDFHVLRAQGESSVDGAWFVLPNEPSDSFKTPSWRAFSGAQLRRFVPQ